MSTTAISAAAPAVPSTNDNVTSERFEVAVGYDLTTDDKDRPRKNPLSMVRPRKTSKRRLRNW
jgi:hypothetical protein